MNQKSDEVSKRGQVSTAKSALLIAIGIFLSRIIGLVRQRIVNHYFGASDAADAFNEAFKIPNVLQNLLGEGVLSASFIPVYANLLARGEEKEAGRVAGAIATLLALAISLLVLIGILTAPFLVSLLAPGFSGAKRQLTIDLVRILFPGTGLLVLSAWCLGILNSHRRFLLSYMAPIIWNLAIIGSLILYGGRIHDFELAVVISWASAIGSALQFLIQLPVVIRLTRGLNFYPDIKNQNIRGIIRTFGPALLSRGVVQVSSYVDGIIGSWLPSGAIALLVNGQTLYMLPISLFGMSITAAELPEMSRALGSEEEIAQNLRNRLNSGLKRVAFFIVPSAVGFLFFGDIMAGAVYQSGRFTRVESIYVWGIIAGYGIGLLPTTLGRLYASTYFALRDTKTPLKFAVIRISISTLAGYILAFYITPLLGIDPLWGITGIAVASGIAGWLEFTLLRNSLNRRIGRTGLPLPFLFRLLLSALLATAIGWGLRLLIGSVHPIISAAIVLGPFGLIYFGLSALWGVQEAKAITGKFTRIIRRK
jgi:putative peptidoglycan lipid II flippase